MKAFTHYLKEATANWVRPDDASLRKEYQIEYKKHLIHELDRDVFPTEQSFLDAIAKAKVVTITPAIDNKIENRSQTGSMASLLNLIKGYRSYPKFRNEKTLKQLEKAITSGKPVDMPIVTKQGKSMRIFAGNTRMDIAFMHGINPQVIMLELPKN